ncbi:SDR family NAD(P)-dependent oxidoreductase [Alteromonadaceae bacterium M269]|nr:SDR family NAD(P)-dependent oxidoreductase [Alteromonadaceae bacterium M269]
MSQWKITNLERQDDKVFLITGANSGIGFTTAKELLRKGATVILAVRNRQKGVEAVSKLKGDILQAKVSMLELDLADLDSVRQFSQNFKANHDRLDVLINNAGIMMPNDYMVSKQGFEIQLATNHFGHFVLTKSLMPLLESTSDSRVVTVSSIATKMKDADIYFDDLQFKKKYVKMASYAQSKLANTMFALELSDRLKESGSHVKSVAAHPGYTATNLQQHMGLLGTIMNALLAQKQEMGALPTLRAATAKQVKGGDYFGPTKMAEYRGYPELVTPPQLALDKKACEKLWTVTEELTKETFSL